MEVRTMDKHEALRRAARACGWSLGPDGSAFSAIHIAERDGQHLVFVASPIQAYYLVVHATGRVRDVGGEEEGITVEWVMRYFGVGRYPLRPGPDSPGSGTQNPQSCTEMELVGAEK